MGQKYKCFERLKICNPRLLDTYLDNTLVYVLS